MNDGDFSSHSLLTIIFSLFALMWFWGWGFNLSKLSKVKVKWSSLPTYFLSRFPLPVDLASKLEKNTNGSFKISRLSSEELLTRHWEKGILSLSKTLDKILIEDNWRKQRGYYNALVIYVQKPWIQFCLPFPILGNGSSVVIVCYFVCLVFVG